MVLAQTLQGRVTQSDPSTGHRTVTELDILVEVNGHDQLTDEESDSVQQAAPGNLVETTSWHDHDTGTLVYRWRHAETVWLEDLDGQVLSPPVTTQS